MNERSLDQFLIHQNLFQHFLIFLRTPPESYSNRLRNVELFLFPVCPESNLLTCQCFSSSSPKKNHYRPLLSSQPLTVSTVLHFSFPLHCTTLKSEECHKKKFRCIRWKRKLQGVSIRIPTAIYFHQKKLFLENKKKKFTNNWSSSQTGSLSLL